MFSGLDLLFIPIPTGTLPDFASEIGDETFHGSSFSRIIHHPHAKIFRKQYNVF